MKAISGILIFYFILIANTTQAQQLPLFTQYRSNWGLINPASLNPDFIRFGNRSSIGISHRTQWTDQPNAPRTQNLHGEHIFDENKVGLLAGGYLLNDQTGPTGFTGIYGRIAGLVTDYDPFDGAFVVGLNFGLVQYRIKTAEGRLINPNDPNILNCDCRKLFPDVGLGLFFHKKFRRGWLKNDNLYAGFSVPQLLGLNLNFLPNNGDFQLQRVQHLYFLAGLYKFINDQTLLEPSVWFKYVPNAPLHANLNLRTLFEISENYQALSLGLGFSLNQIATLALPTDTAGLNLKSSALQLEFGYLFGVDYTFTIGYGFEYSFSTYGPFYGDTHEINLSIGFN